MGARRGGGPFRGRVDSDTTLDELDEGVRSASSGLLRGYPGFQAGEENEAPAEQGRESRFGPGGTGVVSGGQYVGHVYLRYSFRLELTPGQRIALARTFGCARLVYNDALAVRKAAYQADKSRIA
ncbi:helix-turn-helix domain-containing protein, partial [Streptomyces sp. NPDC002599]|uniref:helix-turn-helix domain-containing protein n=1 Tax=Streptomyces sp. NPDC002599 TaxID=3154421 RepID=UPI00332835A1